MNFSLFTRTPLTWGALLPLALLACGSQAGPDYKGESLLTIHGKVTIDNPAAPSSLVPVITFPVYDASDGGYENYFALMDVDVRGDFPSKFTLDVFEPPAIPARDQYQGWLAFGFIAAMPPDHPAKLVHTPKYDELVKSGCLGGDDGGLAGGKCTREYMRCKPSNAPQLVDETTGECYHDVFSCDPTFTHCVPDHAYGDPHYAKGIWQEFAGLSRNYLVMYARKTPTGGPQAVAGVERVQWALNGGKPIAPGYHLLRLDTLTKDELASTAACVDAANAQAVAEYNDAHGTNLAFDGRDPQPPEEASTEVFVEETRLRVEKGCKWVSSEDQHTYTVVPTGEGHPVTVEIGTDVRPLGVYPGL